jgi:long-chain acyl-CoA synthetase
MPTAPPTPATLADIFFSIVDRNDARAMLYEQRGTWVPLSSRELYRRVAAVAAWLRARGLVSGDRVAILAENRPEWAIADFAALMTGAAVVPIYATQTAEQCAHILRDSETRFLFVSSLEQLHKVLPLLPETRVEQLILMDEPTGVLPAEASQMQAIMMQGPEQRDSEFDQGGRQIAPTQLATLIYTSGTTGTPKGVMLSHRNLASNIAVSLEHFEMSDGDITLSFLPLSHITARHCDIAMMYRGVSIAYCSRFEDLPRALQQVRPTVFIAVPRVLEKIYNQVQLRVGSGPRRKLYDWAMTIARRSLPEIVAGRTPRSVAWQLANKLVFSKVRNAMGRRVRTIISGGAPLGIELAEWFASIGLPVMEGYGLTETSPVVAVNAPRSFRPGTVGKPLSGVEVRVADDGEIIVRAPSVFQGYWNLPEETQNAFDGEWFKTGDIGSLDENGFLSITDRKKNLIKTSGGKFIAPQPIENRLKSNPLVSESALIGDRRRFPAVLIAPAFPALEDWAKQHGVNFNSNAELVADAKVHALYQEIISNLNRDLARFEQIKKFLLLPEPPTIADGTLTPTLKLRRRELEVRYRSQIDMLYAEPVVLEREVA